MQTLLTGARTPFFVYDYVFYGSIAAATVDPIATYLTSYPADVSGALANDRRSALDLYIKNGFLVQNATDTAGYIYAVTWAQYEEFRRNNKATCLTIAAIVPRQIYLGSGDWTMTPIIKVFAGNDATYASTVVTVNVGLVR